MTRQTDVQLIAQLGTVSAALGLPLHHHTGSDGFAVGALRILRQDGYRYLYRVANNAGAGDDLTGACTVPELRAFLRGMLAAARIADARHAADAQAVDAVAELLSASDWSSDHLAAVADTVRAAGRTVADL